MRLLQRGRVAVALTRALTCAFTGSLTFAPAVAVSAGGADPLPDILAAIVGQPLVQAPFFELRSSVLFARPVESRGTLSFTPPDRIEKRTEQPVRERVTLAGDTLTIQEGDSGTPKSFRLDGQGGAGAWARGVRAIVAGDPAPLRQHFELETTGGLTAWQLVLRPRDPGLRRSVTRIVVEGAGGRVRRIETTEAGGDVSELTILDAPAVNPAR